MIWINRLKTCDRLLLGFALLSLTTIGGGLISLALSASNANVETLVAGGVLVVTLGYVLTTLLARVSLRTVVIDSRHALPASSLRPPAITSE